MSRLIKILAIVVLGFIAAWFWFYTKESPNARVRCLQQNIYHEARLEPFESKEAVAFVTVARALYRPSMFPRSVCRVVYQRNAFSWTRTPGLRERDLSRVLTPSVQRIAEKYAVVASLKELELYGKQLKLPLDAHYYKRFDLDEFNVLERRMSNASRWFWQKCLEKIVDAQGMAVRHGAHVFYRQRAGKCPKYASTKKI